MKRSNVLFASVAAVAIILAGCAKENPVAGKQEANTDGVLTVKIKSEKASRAELDGTTTDPLVRQFENRVVGFSAYVFNWDTGDLEAKATSAGGVATITGLNTIGTKRVVVIANAVRTDLPNSFIPQFDLNPNYSRIAEGYLSLADQSFANFTVGDKGFVMTGENASALTIVEGTNTAEITVKRVVAKVQLGEITFDDEVSLNDLANFNVKEVSIQKAAGYSTLGAGTITTPAVPSPAWYGGEQGDPKPGAISAALPALMNTTPGFATYLTNLAATLGFNDLTAMAASNLRLGEAKAAANGGSGVVIAPYTNPNFWYVLPNADAANPTLLALHGDYRSVNNDYPVEVNAADAAGPHIDRNTIYTINLKFRGFVGIDDPDVAGKIATLEVTVDVADWEGPVVQNSTW